MNNEKQKEYYERFIETVKDLREHRRELEINKLRLEKLNKQAIFFKDRYKKTNKISEFECAKHLKEIKVSKLIFEKEVKSLKNIIAVHEDYIFVYQEEFGTQNIDQIEEGKHPARLLEWLYKNGWYNDPKFKEETSDTLCLHYLLVAEDLIIGTHFYYDELNRRISEQYPDLSVVDIDE